MRDDEGLLSRILIFSFLALLGLLINGAALFKLITGWKRSSSTNILAFNLIFADTVFLLSTISLDVSGSSHYELARPVPYKALSILYGVNIYMFSCSVFTTSIFSVDKFKAMTRPFQYKVNKRDGLIRLVTLHGVSLVSSLPFIILQGTQNGDCKGIDCSLACRIYVYVLFVCQVAVPFPLVIVLQFKALISIVAENSRTIEMSKRIIKSASEPKDFPMIERSSSVASRITSFSERAKQTVRSISSIFVGEDEKDYLNELALKRRQQTISACKQFSCIILTLTVLILPDRILTISTAEEDLDTTSTKYHLVTTVFLCMSTCMNPFIYGGLCLPSSGARLRDDRTTTQDLKGVQYDTRRRRGTIIDVIHDPIYDNSVSEPSGSDEDDQNDYKGLQMPFCLEDSIFKFTALKSTTTKAELSPRRGPRIIITEFHFTTDTKEDVFLGYKPQVFPEFLNNLGETSKCLDTLQVLSTNDLISNCKLSPETSC